MRKQDFINFFNENSQSLSIDSQISLLKKIKDKWIPELIDKKLKNYSYCVGCRKYVKTKAFKTERKDVLASNAHVYHDAGYGDSDRYADVTYDTVYSVCPNCSHKKIISRYPKEITNEHER